MMDEARSIRYSLNPLDCAKLCFRAVNETVPCLHQIFRSKVTVYFSGTDPPRLRHEVTNPDGEHSLKAPTALVHPAKLGLILPGD